MTSGDSGNFLEEKFGEKNFKTHSKLNKKAKSIEIVKSGPTVLAYLFKLADENSRIRSIMSFLMRFLSTLV